MEENAKHISLAAISPYKEKVIEAPTEKRGSAGEWVFWGDRNTYPNYIDDLCRTTPTLRAVIQGCVDYIVGDDVIALHGLSGRAAGAFDRNGSTARELVERTAKQALRGGFAWKVTKNEDGTLGELENIPLRFLRSDEDNQAFWYSEKWGNGRSNETIRYARWFPDTQEKESILFVKLWGDGVYPEPLFAAAVKACETERSIDDFHLGNISRGFMGSYLVNFNGGAMPTPQEQKEVEALFTQKFGGSKNAGRIMFSWNRDIASRTTFEKMEVSDYGEKYETLSKHCRAQIFTAFRANPNLFGIATESNGFNSEEYESAFKLFNRTVIQPIQRRILDAFERVMDEKGVVSIKPFSMEGETEKTVQ